MFHTFSLQFQYNNGEYTAIISEIRDSISVYIPDQTLHHILPLGRFYYDAVNGPNIDLLNRTPVEDLMIIVQEAIDLSGKCTGVSFQTKN